MIDSNLAILADTTLNGVPASVLRPVPDLIRILRDEIFIPDGPVSPMARGDVQTLMRTDEAKVRIINNTYTAGLEECTTGFLTSPGMDVVEYGVPTEAASQTKLILYTPKLYALRYLTELFGAGSPQIVIQPDPASNVDIEIRIGEDWVTRLPVGY